MKLRTTSIGLPKTHARIARKHVEARDITRPFTMPVSGLGDLMLTYVSWEHDQRAPKAEVALEHVSCVPRTDPSLLKMAPYRAPAQKRPW